VTLTDLTTVDAHTAPIEAPTAFAPQQVAPDVHLLPAYLPVPGMGVLPANSFFVDGPEPMLIDAGPGGAEDGWRRALSSLVDPSDLRWLWLTHTDPDHMASLGWLLEVAPNLRVITTFLAVGKLGMHQPLPLDRAYFANPGDTVTIGGRTFAALRPPTFDAPETTAAFDVERRTLFSADSFGALMQAPAPVADEIDHGDLVDGMTLWGSIDAPWVGSVDRLRFDAALAEWRDLGASRVLSAHLPPAEGMTNRLLDIVAATPDATPWVGPDQGALEAMLSQVHAG
jgi:glyoxylase-like metal-dependent hydrolase (beta-lactamase superfamily II)